MFPDFTYLLPTYVRMGTSLPPLSSLPCLTLYPELWGLNSDREKLRLQREKGERTPIGKSLLLECKSGTPMAGLASGLTQMVNEVIEGGVAPRKVSA